MDLKAYYRLISSEGRAKKYLSEKSSKIVTAFALAAGAESFTNYERDGIVVLAVNITSTSFQEGGSTRDV